MMWSKILSFESYACKIFVLAPPCVDMQRALQPLIGVSGTLGNESMEDATQEAEYKVDVLNMMFEIHLTALMRQAKPLKAEMQRA